MYVPPSYGTICHVSCSSIDKKGCSCGIVCTGNAVCNIGRCNNAGNTEKVWDRHNAVFLLHWVWVDAILSGWWPGRGEKSNWSRWTKGRTGVEETGNRAVERWLQWFTSGEEMCWRKKWRWLEGWRQSSAGQLKRVVSPKTSCKAWNCHPKQKASAIWNQGEDR